MTTSISINHLALQVSWLLFALFIGRKLFGFLGGFSEFFAGMPSVLHGIFGGAILWYLLKLTKLERFVDLKTIKMASGFCLEITVFTAMATLDMEFVSTYIVPVLIYMAVLTLLTIPIVFYLAYRFCREEWFEKACMSFGAATGNTSTGLALVRADVYKRQVAERGKHLRILLIILVYRSVVFNNLDHFVLLSMNKTSEIKSPIPSAKQMIWDESLAVPPKLPDCHPAAQMIVT